MSVEADIFNLNVDEQPSTGGSNENIIFKLNAKDGPNDTASAVIKLIPDINNPSKLWVNKWTVYLENPVTEEKKMIDCPSSISEPSILQDAFFALRKSNNASEKALQSYFKRKEVYFSLCEIIQDPQNKENEGKIKVFRYGIKVFEKIKNLMWPESDMIEKNIPFDLFEGRPLLLKVKIVSGFNNFDDSVFLDKHLPIGLVNFDESGKPMRDAKDKIIRTHVEKNAKNYEKIKTYLKEHTPAELANYEYKPWSEETWTFVSEAIESIIPNDRIVDKLFKKYNVKRSNGVEVKTRDVATNKTSTSPKIDLDDDTNETNDFDDIDDILNSGKKQTKPTTTKQQKEEPKKKQGVIDEDIDDIDLGDISLDDDDDDYSDL